ncbi:glycine cleavage system H protein [Waddlia chondrophila 2032/99]|uniref:Glycine cleavage system H protein n=2 Tax=Waddlia chondrophila TaxID=71667 RepID=D6YU28_WADCW|nr:glycine cleavage system protein GcvH [Waddlia chondrophila]ADI37639.1 Glycine cleavage system H protein [Waddlia chondrophila WSU 86-1044]CCB90614.1 glycine cleavage system H protein [Waddlia chondrophila 2032/99]
MKYTESHEWIDLEGSIGTVGVTDYAQKELGDIVYVELPEVGKEVNAGDEIAVLESTKAAADIYAPVSGTIIEVNEVLNDQPEEINISPMDDGWLFKIELKDKDELDQLMSQSEYLETVQ